MSDTQGAPTPGDSKNDPPRPSESSQSSDRDRSDAPPSENPGAILSMYHTLEDYNAHRPTPEQLTAFRVAAVIAGFKRGFSFTPLNGKKPILSGWQKAPRETLEQAIEWAKAGNIGVRTGAPSGIIVIDDDNEYNIAQAQLGLPPTFTVETGGHKKHYYYRYPGRPIKNSVSKLSKLVDVRADGGQAVYIGSIHPDTKDPYDILGPKKFNDMEIVDLPAAVLARIEGDDPNRADGGPGVSPKETGGAKSKSGEQKSGKRKSGESGRLEEFATGQLEKAARRVAGAPEGTRNDTLNREAFRIARYVNAKILDRNTALATLLSAAERSGLTSAEATPTIQRAFEAKHERELDTKRLGKRLAAQIRRQSERKLREAAGMQGVPPRPPVPIFPGEVHDTVDQLERVLAAQAEAPIYRYGDTLVRMTTVASPEPGRTHCRIQVADVPSIIDIATRFAQFLKPSENEEAEPKPVDCPDKVAKVFLSRAGSTVRVLNGIVRAPTLRRDGSVIAARGYDAQSGLFLDIAANDMVAVPESPTHADALAALDVLARPLASFPFVSPADKSVVLAAIFTALVRRSIRSSPLFAFRAPTMGTGKSMLCDIVSLIASGAPAPSMPQGKDEEEDRKRILATLIQAEPIAVVDNAERPLGGGALCCVLTQEVFQDRVLGESRMVRLPTHTLWLANGNNLQFEGDIITRVLVCDLDARCERPEERAFEGDLRSAVKANRMELAIAAITVLRAYVIAGKPPQSLGTFGRFEEWSDLIRSALVWCGQPDPCVVRSRLVEVDPTAVRFEALLRAWHQAFGGENLRVADVVTTTRTMELRSVIEEIAGLQQGGVDARRLGQFLNKMRGRVARGLRLDRAGVRHGAALWRVRPEGGDARAAEAASEGGCGGSGGSSQPTREKDSDHQVHACMRAHVCSSACTDACAWAEKVPHIPHIHPETEGAPSGPPTGAPESPPAEVPTTPAPLPEPADGECALHRDLTAPPQPPRCVCSPRRDARRLESGVVWVCNRCHPIADPDGGPWVFFRDPPTPSTADAENAP